MTFRVQPPSLMVMEEVQDLVEAAAESADAWERLWIVIEPQLWDLVDRPRFASHLAHTEDSRQRIMTAIRAQLSADRCQQLQRYLEARRINPRLGFSRWLRTIAKRIGMSYASYELAEPVRRRSARRL